MVDEERIVISKEEAKQVGELVASVIVLTEEEARQIDLEELATGTAGIFDPIGQLQAWLAEQLNALVSVIVTPLQEAINSIGNWLYTNIGNAIQGLVDSVVNTFNEIIKPVSDVVNNIWTGLNTLIGAISELSSTFLEGLSNIIDTVNKGFNLLGSTLTGFVNAIMNFPQWFPEWFQKYIAEPISNAIQSIWFVDVGAVFNAVSAGVYTGFTVVWNAVQGAVTWLSAQVISAGKAFVEGLQGLFEQTVSVMVTFADWIRDKFIAPYFANLPQTLESSVLGVLSTGTARGEVGVLTGVFWSMSWELFKVLAPIEVFRGLVEMVSEIEISAKFLGAGGAGKIKPLKILDTLATLYAELAKAFFTGAFFGLAMHMLEPYRWFIRPDAKELFDTIFKERYGIEAFFEAPSVTALRDLLRRSMVWVEDFSKLVKGELPDEFKAVYDTVRKILEVRGYPTFFVEYYLDLGTKYSMAVTDRFGTKRVVPFSPLFTVPTHSEAVRMLQRDVFQSPQEWSRFVRIYGWSEDLAKMYYMFSFQYPSFEKLWTFLVRGISGMLWYKAPELIKQIFNADADWLGAGRPVDPYNLNYDYKALFTAIGIYAKWIQLSNFSWFRKGATLQYGDVKLTIDFDWTADSWLMWDIAADLPGKIDARWMTKWGIFDYLTEKLGLTVAEVKPYPEEAFVDLVVNAIEDRVTSKVVMDLRPFCRLLTANGLHPAWVPITAVAEAINALTDERTLLRTGFINLFKEGFFSYETLDKLLEGFVTASFVVEWFDIETKQWKAGAINIPVRYLPAERKLLELRAVMDRALDILRDLVRELNRAYREHIIETHEDYSKVLLSGVSAVNEWFRELMREITGKELAVTVDKDYWKAYATVLDLERYVYTIERMRYWASRYIGWIIYRLGYGYVKPEEAQKLIEAIAKACRLTDAETELLKTIASAISGFARREYVPTPMQLATIAEVVPEARQLFDKVVEARNIPSEWVEVWRKYVEVKPIVDEVKRYLSIVEDLYQRGLIDDDALKAAYEAYKAFGFEDYEIELRLKTAQLERAKQAWTWLVGTPRELVTMAEYSPKARKLALTIVNKLVDALPVDEETKQALREMWEEYIRIRPVMDEVRRYVTELINAYAEGVIGDTELEQELEFLRKWGYDDYELELIREIARRRRIRRLARYGGP